MCCLRSSLEAFFCLFLLILHFFITRPFVTDKLSLSLSRSSNLQGVLLTDATRRTKEHDVSPQPA